MSGRQQSFWVKEEDLDEMHLLARQLGISYSKLMGRFLREGLDRAKRAGKK